MLATARWVLLALAVAGAVFVAAVARPRGRGGPVAPSMNDITTDTQDPPAFVDVLPYRRWASNPPEYPGEAAASRQRATWPDIGPLDTRVARARVHALAREAMRRAGWRIVGDRPGEGRLEAIATTRLLRFKDDIVVRLRDRAEGGTRVDIRSKSRIGRSDLGTNARRIRAFLAELGALLKAEP